MNKNKQTCILILGMHRSGTSALTGLLYDNELFIGNNLLAPQEDNQKGFFENINILKLNNKILAKLNSSWDNVTFDISEINQEQEIYFVNEIKKTILNEFKNIDTFGIKDPRISILLPFWLKAFSDLNISVKTIFIYRNPYEVALSLEKRNQFSFEKSLNLWLLYTRSIINYIGKIQVELITYRELMNNTEISIKNLIEKLSILTSLQDNDIRINLIEQNLYHAKFDDDVNNKYIKGVIKAIKSEDWFNNLKEALEMYEEDRKFFYFNELKKQIKNNIDFQKQILNLKTKIKDKK